ncbi:MAG: protein kinase domain-containing protein, partial [Nitrospinota bacterium]
MSESRTCLKCGKINEASNSLCIECNAALTLDESDNFTIANGSPGSDLSDDDFDDVVTEHNIDQMFAASNPPLEQTKVELESDETVIIEGQSSIQESDSGATTLIADQNSTVAEAASTLIAESFVDPIKRHKATMSHSSLESVDDVTTDWKIGDTIIGLYHISDLLGEGGMGKVYKVRHLGWNVELAVKSPKLEALASLGGPEIFEEEAKTWVDLGLHPHIVSCYYVRRLGNIPRIFAEYIRNCSLKDLIKSGKLRDLATLIDIGVQAAWGLEYSHKMGLVHQDIKPANIMITEKNIAKVTDFGLAKWRSVSRSDSADKSDNLVEFSGMTPAYCSPEQANRASLSAKTDIWSWGLTFLEMLAGERTWLNGVAAPEALDRHVEASKKEGGTGFKIPVKIATLLNNIFQDNPEDRPGSMLLVADQLTQIYGELFDQKYMREFPKISRVTTDSLNNKAISLIDLDHIEKGIKTLEQAVVNEPNHPEATLNYSLMKWRIGDITDSVVINMLEEMIKHQSLETSAFYYLALAHMERDDCKKALEALETIISSDPRIEEVKALQNLAREQLDKSKKLDLTFDFHTESVNAIALSSKKNILLTGSDDHSAKLIDIATNKVLYKFEPTSLAITSVALSEDGTIAAIGSYRQIDLYNLQDGTKIKTLDMEGGWVTMLKIDSSNKYIGSAISDESLKITDIDSNLVLSSFPTFYGCCSISDNFKRVLFQNKEGSCELLDVNKEEQLKLFDQTCSAVKLNEDGTIAAIANLNGHIDIWSTDQPS